MGIRGFSTYVRQNQLFEEHHLHDTTLVIDGMNLVNTLYFKYQKDNRNDHMFGGDYSLWSVYVRNFFNSLKTCGVVPIVILDGSFDPSKLETKQRRFKSNLASAFKIYKHNCFDEGINPLLNFFVFRQILKNCNVQHYQSIYEADDIIPQIARDLQCPILSNDSDFLIDLLPGGVIPIDYLLDNFRVFTFEADGKLKYKYFHCYIFKLQHLKQKFPRINLDLVPLCSAILGNDYISIDANNCILRRIPKFSYTGNNRQKQINSVLNWVCNYSDQQSILEELRKFSKDPNHRLIEYIESHFYAKQETSNTVQLSIEQYFATNLEKLFFFKKLAIPLWAHHRFVQNNISNRLLCILEAHIEWFRPLVEDFSFTESSYECVFELCLYIYGLLRNSNENVPKIKRYSRKSANLVVEKIAPRIYLHNDQLLPMLKDIEFMSEQDRLSLFFAITVINPAMPSQLKRMIVDHNLGEGFTVNESLVDQLVVMLLVVHYFCVHFRHDLWLEFVYALYFNILLSGHFCGEDVPVFLKIETNFRKLLHEKLRPLSKVPTFSGIKVFMPRVVHFYNSFQNCLLNIVFLAEILDLTTHFNVENYVSCLKGTFIYNLTCDLAGRTKPLLHLEELLGRQKFMALRLFRNLLDFVLTNSNRKLLINGQCDKDVVPDSLLTSKVSTVSGEDEGQSAEYQFLVRAYEATNRKTHIASQKLKLRSNRSRRK